MVCKPRARSPLRRGLKPGEGFNGTPEHFNESKRVDLTGEDIRFTTKGSTLYAFAMGWNRGETRIAALAPARGLERRKIARVELLGSQQPVRWKLAGDGLHIESPGAGRANTPWRSGFCLARPSQKARMLLTVHHVKRPCTQSLEAAVCWSGHRHGLPAARQ
jgi:hypothetical protein